MRVTAISIHANEEEVVRFALRSEKSSSRYMVRQITGMDADEITPKFYGFGNSGVKFYDFGMKQRELAIRVILNPTFALNEEHSHIRDELYRAISTSRTGAVEVRFHSGGGTVGKLSGFITKLEAGYFNKTPEAQLTIRCDDPMIRAIAPYKLDLTSQPANPVSVPDTQSTAPHGFSFTGEFTGVETEFEVACPYGEWAFKIVPTNQFEIGDVLMFSSEYSNKKIQVDRGGLGNVEGLMNAVVTTSIWPTMFPGSNIFNFVQLANFEVQEVTYHAAYWGV